MRQAARIAGRDHIGTALNTPDFFRSLGNLWHRRELLSFMTVRHLRGMYKQSVLGYAWALLMPLAQMICISFAISTIMKIPSQGVPFSLFLMVGLLPWNFFANSVSSATDSVVGSSSLVTKVYFPREILPASAILTKVVDLLFASIILVGMMAYFEHAPTIEMLWVPVLFLTQFVWVLGLSLPLAALNLYFHDVRYLVGVALTLGFYLTPIIYSIDIVPEQYKILFELNPMSLFINAYRRVILYGESPDTEKLLIGLAIAVGTFLIGYWLFKKMEPGFADRI
jgi:lipopolysaccharide transport system permease protein